MRRKTRLTIAVAFATAAIGAAGCATGGGTPSTQIGRLVLGASVAYIGTTNVCVRPAASNCVRASGTPGNYVSISQAGNASNFALSSADPSVAGGNIVMQGPGGVGSPAIELIGYKAGTTLLTVTGKSSATASLTITVTTVSTLTVLLNDLPTVTNLAFNVRAPANAGCIGFEGGYSFNWGPIAAAQIVLENFPAMGAGALDRCLFTTVEIVGSDAIGANVVDKIFQLTIALGRDNPATLTLP